MSQSWPSNCWIFEDSNDNLWFITVIIIKSTGNNNSLTKNNLQNNDVVVKMS